MDRSRKSLGSRLRAHPHSAQGDPKEGRQPGRPLEPVIVQSLWLTGFDMPGADLSEAVKLVRDAGGSKACREALTEALEFLAKPE